MTDLASLLPRVRELRSQGYGSRKIGAELGIGKDAALRLLKKVELEDAKGSALLAIVEVEPQTAPEFAERIAQCYRRSKEAIIEAGRWLIRAKTALPHGVFEAMIESDLPFGPRHARRLVAIAEDGRLSDRTYESVLPEAVGTLYELTQLDDAAFKSKVEDGTIRPDMERRDIATVVKKQRRAERERQLSSAILDLPQKRYGVILADPPWRFETYSRETGMDRAADNHYPTSPTEEIERLPVPTIAAKDCVLFLWATAPMLPDALRVMAAWGFEYKSHCIWRKDRVGTGYWFRNAHELLLVGVSKGGSVPAPAPGAREVSVTDAAVGAHSEKPDIFMEFIESWYPNLPKIELNARRARPGWDAWGLDAPTPSHDPETGEVTEAAE